MNLTKPVVLFIVSSLLCICNYTQGQSVLIRQEQRKLPLLTDSISIVNSLNRVGMLYHLKNPDSCFYYGIKAKLIATRLNYEKGEADANNVIGTAFYLKAFYKESLELYNKSLLIYRMHADTANIVQLIMNMGVVYEALNDSSQANSFYLNAIETGLNLKQDSIMSLAYTNYAQFNDKLPLTKRLDYLDKSFKIAHKFNDKLMQNVVRQTKAELFLENGRRQEGFTILQQSLTEAKKAGMETLEINACGRLAGYYENQPDSALYYCIQGYRQAKKNGYTFLEVRILKAILFSTEKTGSSSKIDSIHYLLETALEAQNVSMGKFVGDYVKYASIQEDNRLLAVRNKNNQAKIWLLIGLCGTSVLLIVFIYRMYRSSRRINLLINEQNTQMQKTLNALEQSQADNTRMMQIVAHDLRNPIGGMYSIVSLMLDNDHHNEDDRMMLELIKTSGQNSLDLVSDLLQVHTQAEQLKKEPVDLKEMLNYCVDLLRYKAEAKGQQLKLQTIQVIIPASREKLWRVLSNLIANAIKFSPTGGFISVRLEKVKNTARIIVADNGIGIPDEMKDEIFDMYTVTKRPGTAGEQPFGMGLSISKQIIVAHQGKIWFESNKGQGTTFYIELPV